MKEIELQPASLEVWDQKYRYRDTAGMPIDKSVHDSMVRVSAALASVETDQEIWQQNFLWAMENGAIPAGRIFSNAGATEHKPNTTLINCLAGETLVTTINGPTPICELVGKRTTIRNRDGKWVLVEFLAHGEQPVFAVSLRHSIDTSTTVVVRATAAHRWYLLDGTVVTTDFWLASAGHWLEFPQHFKKVPHVLQAGAGTGGWWEVVAIDEHPTTVPVFCCTEPATGGFCLFDGMVTGNCVVSKNITDSMEGIMSSVYEGALTIQTGAGVGFCFSTIRPRGSFIFGHGACFDQDTLVQTDLGKIRFADLSRWMADGRQFATWCALPDGSFARTPIVRCWFTKKTSDIVRVTLDSGEVIVCTADHRWLLADGNYVEAQFLTHLMELRTRTQYTQLIVDHVSAEIGTPLLPPMGECYASFSPHVVRVERVSKIHSVYDLEVAHEVGNFLLGAGVFVHNSTGGSLPFMDIFDRMCFSIASAGGRRGAMMATMHVWHPDIFDYVRSKRENGRLRQFNMSVLITDEFLHAVKTDGDWQLYFPFHRKEFELLGLTTSDDALVWEMWPTIEPYHVRRESDGRVACKVYATVKATELWNLIMRSNYDYAEPGFILIDEINRMNNLWWCEDIVATNPCGEIPIPPWGACLLGSVDLTKFVMEPFTSTAHFDWDRYSKVLAIFTRMLDNVVELSNLPLPQQRAEIVAKRRHGMGYLGLGSTLAMLGIKYGNAQSLVFTEKVTQRMAVVGWETCLELAKVKGPAPIFATKHTVTPTMLAKCPQLGVDGHKIGSKVRGSVLWGYSKYVQRLATIIPETVAELCKIGPRFSHATAIAPTGCLSGSTHVVTNRGMVRLGDLGRGFSKWQPLSNLQVASDHASLQDCPQFFRNGLARVVSLEFASGRRMMLTPQHKLRDFNWEWVAASDMQVGSILPVATNYWPHLEPVVVSTYCGGKTIELDEKLGYMFGVIDAVGTVGSGVIECYLSYNSGAVGNTLRYACSEFGYDLDLSNLPFVVIDDICLFEFLVANNLLASRRDVSAAICASPKSVVKGYLAGALHSSGIRGANGDSLMLWHKSMPWIETVLQLAQAVGYFGVVENRATLPFWQENCAMWTGNACARLINDLVLGEPVADVGDNNPFWLLPELEKPFVAATHSVGEHLPDFVFDRVVNIGRSLAFTYDLEVPANTTYLANGYVSHNTISLAMGNNASNGIEPSFAHSYLRNIIKPGRKTKESMTVYSAEYLAYKQLHPNCVLEELPDCFVVADQISPMAAVDVQAAAQKWVDQSISRTVNCPTDMEYDKFREIYLYGHEVGLKGCTTFRFSPEAFQGVLVREDDLKNTLYEFVLDDGTKVELAGNAMVELPDGELVTAANLFDSLKEGTFGKY